MRRRFLVTGGAGYVGSHVVLALMERGDDVTVLDNLSQGHRAAIPDGVRLVTADLGDAAPVDALLAEGEWHAVLHFAALSLVGDSMREPFRYMLENAGNGIRLIEAAYGMVYSGSACPRPPPYSVIPRRFQSARTRRSTRALPTVRANG